MSTPIKAQSKVFAFLRENGKKLGRWVKRNERALIMALVPTSIIVADARSGRKDAKEDFEFLKKKLTKTNHVVKDMDKRLVLVENKQNFSQAFALRSAVNIMKLVSGGGDEADKEEIKQFIKDGEELMGCKKRGGEGCEGGDT